MQGRDWPRDWAGLAIAVITVGAMVWCAVEFWAWIAHRAGAHPLGLW